MEGQSLKRIAQLLRKLLINVSVSAAEKSANRACEPYGYQPKEPESVKKMRKF